MQPPCNKPMFGTVNGQCVSTCDTTINDVTDMGNMQLCAVKCPKPSFITMQSTCDSACDSTQFEVHDMGSV